MFLTRFTKKEWEFSLEEITKELIYKQYQREFQCSVLLRNIEYIIIISHTWNWSWIYWEFYFVSFSFNNTKERFKTIEEVRQYIEKILKIFWFKEKWIDLTIDFSEQYSFKKDTEYNFSDREDITIDLDRKDEILISQFCLLQESYKLILLAKKQKVVINCLYQYKKEEKEHILTLWKHIITTKSIKELKLWFWNFLIRQFKFLWFWNLSFYEGALEKTELLDTRKNIIPEWGEHKYLNLAFWSDSVSKSTTIHSHFSIWAQSLTLGKVWLIWLPGPLILEHIKEYENYFKPKSSNSLYLFLYENEEEIYKSINSKFLQSKYNWKNKTHTIIENRTLSVEEIFVIIETKSKKERIRNWFIDWDTISNYSPTLIINLIEKLRILIRQNYELKITMSFTFSRRGINTKEVNEYLSNLIQEWVLNRDQFFIDLTYNVKEEPSMRICRLENHKWATYNYLSEQISNKYRVELLQSSTYNWINWYPMSQVTFKL